MRTLFLNQLVYKYLAALVFSFSCLCNSASGSTVNFMCFFDPGSDALSERCEIVLRDFVSRAWDLAQGRARGDPNGLVAVAGNVDGAEAAGGASFVGAQRARAVGEWLVQAGVPRSAVLARNYEAQVPLVPHRSPNVAEPQNRYVQVYIRAPDTRMTPQVPFLNLYP